MIDGAVGSLTFVHPDSVAWILATGDQPADGVLVDGKCLVVEVNRGVSVALAVEDALVAVGVVGEEVLVQALQRPLLNGDGRSAFVKRTECAVEDGLIASEVHCVQLEDELAFAQRHNGVRLCRVLVIVQKGWERVRVLVVLEKVRGLLEDVRSLVFRPIDSYSVNNARVRVSSEGGISILSRRCLKHRGNWENTRLDVKVGDNSNAHPSSPSARPE